MTRSIMLLQHGHHLWVCFFKQPLCTLFGQLACLTALFECPLLYNRSWSRHQCGGRKSKEDKHRFNFGFKCNRSFISEWCPCSYQNDHGRSQNNQVSRRPLVHSVQLAEGHRDALGYGVTEDA